MTAATTMAIFKMILMKLSTTSTSSLPTKLILLIVISIGIFQDSLGQLSFPRFSPKA
jgi:hypothetical protein